MSPGGAASTDAASAGSVKGGGANKSTSKLPIRDALNSRPTKKASFASKSSMIFRKSYGEEVTKVVPNGVSLVKVGIMCKFREITKPDPHKKATKFETHLYNDKK